MNESTKAKDSLVAFKATDPAVLEIWNIWSVEMTAQRERLSAFRKEIDPDGLLDLRVRNQSTIAWTPFTCKPDTKDFTAPAGWSWRHSKDYDYMAPKRNTKIGAEWQKRIDEVNAQAPKSLSFPGMPATVWAHREQGTYILSFGSFEYEGAVYVYWTALPEGVDRTIWTELKLSAFYAVKEAAGL